MKACRNCRKIVEEGETCPVCGSDELSDRFSGMLIVLDPEKSEIGKITEIKAPGRYAVKVK
ncbi:MAG: transcription elongation factor subunit Spt4 [Candidatus Micrarchaeia archaeon]